MSEPRPTQGRDAPSPWKMPLSGWKEVLLRVKNDVVDERMTMTAAGVAFFWMLAIFPAIAAGMSIWGMFADPEAVTQTFQQLSDVMPEQARNIIGSQLRDVAASAGGALGFGAVVGLLVLLWSANAGMKSLMSGLNMTWETEEDRSFLMLNLWSFALLLAVALFGVIAVASFALLPVIQGLGLLGDTVGTVLVVVRWPLLAFLASVLVAVIYRYGPSRPPPHWRWLSPGAVLATIGFLVVSVGFSLYVQNFGSYNETYGSLAGVVVTLLWLWLNALVILLGGELDAELENQTVHQTRTA